MSNRSIAKIARPEPQRHGAKLTTWDIGRDLIGPAIEPFIFVSLYDMAGPTFPPHPHAGFSVATYILPESPIGFVNQDTLGNRNRIAPGALHVTVAGSGVMHEEQPERAGPVARGFQIWIDHAAKDREMPPEARHLRADAVPLILGKDSSVRVVLGKAGDIISPVTAPTSVRVIDVILDPGAAFEQAIDPAENAFLFVLDGSLEISGERIDAAMVASFAHNGSGIAARAGNDGTRFTLFSGIPHGEAQIQRGPFVASNDLQLARFARNFQAGQFGSLSPISSQPGWQPNDGQTIA